MMIDASTFWQISLRRKNCAIVHVSFAIQNYCFVSSQLAVISYLIIRVQLCQVHAPTTIADDRNPIFILHFIVVVRNRTDVNSL